MPEVLEQPERRRFAGPLSQLPDRPATAVASGRIGTSPQGDGDTVGVAPCGGGKQRGISPSASGVIGQGRTEQRADPVMSAGLGVRQWTHAVAP